jgi:DNA-binding phage protein
MKVRSLPLQMRKANLARSTRQHNVSDLARRAGIERTALYRAFAGRETHPNFSTVLNLLNVMGFESCVANRESVQACMSPVKAHTCGIFDPD